MKKNVNISLISSQFDGDKTERIEMMTEGELTTRKDGYIISYPETDMSGKMNGTQTKLLVSKDRLELHRTGEIRSDLILEPGKKHQCHYSTPFGDMFVGVLTKSLNSTMTPKGGALDFCYVLDVNSSYIGDFEISINVDPINI